MASIKAPVAGEVHWVCKVGDVIRKGSPVAVLSVMKMEVRVEAKENYSVNMVKCKVGDIVKERTELARVSVVEGVPAQTTMKQEMPFKDRIERLKARRVKVKEMGGTKRVLKQKEKGKLNARDRIELFADKGSFREVGSAAGSITHSVPTKANSEKAVAKDEKTFIPANFLMGVAKLDSRPVVLGVDDFTINASHSGAGGIMLMRKYMVADRLAQQYKIPMIRVLDGASGGGSVKAVLSIGHSYIPMVPGCNEMLQLVQTVPVVSVCAGPVIGLAAVKLSASHLRVFVSKIASVAVAGTAVVEAITGEPITMDALGGEGVVVQSGAVDVIVQSEQEAAATVTRFLSYLPSSKHHPPQNIAPRAPALSPTTLDTLIAEDPRASYSIETILGAILDEDSAFEISSFYAREVMTILGRVDGVTVGVVFAGNPSYEGGVLTAKASKKLVRFINLCETFNLKMIMLVDMPGISAGPSSERENTLDAAVELAGRLYGLKVPSFAVILRRCFGVGGAMFHDAPGTERVAWVSADWGSLPTAGGRKAAKQEQGMAALIDWKELMDPVRTAEVFGIEDMILPSKTPALLREWVQLSGHAGAAKL
eukprot:TRINITY_DN4494_c0_g1_i1.p1 TRINITY_DN4494_c0_g1~~TRINITY_DN4494_c0_g1_i1.p1  ORF type:complete len:595 (+),score=150.99 TRINITY_DN4494_c0_g1_i1:43-1827(+)